MGIFEDAVEQDEHPRGDASDAGYVFVFNILYDSFQFAFPFAHQGYFVAWGTAPFSPKGEVFDEDSGEVSEVCIILLVEFFTSA